MVRDIVFANGIMDLEGREQNLAVAKHTNHACGFEL
jgi:hypothetical protein